MKRFPTKVDLWIAAVMALAPLAIVGASVATRHWGVLLGGLAYLSLLAILIWPCEYLLTDNELVVRSGVIRWRVPLDKIEKVDPTRNPLSSPAWSLDRLMIRYGKKGIMISPRERSRFLDDLASRAGLRRYGDRLVRERR